MTYFPDTRKDRNYSDSKLKDQDARLIEGYDFAAKIASEQFIANIDVYHEEFDLEGEDINLAKFLENHPRIANALGNSIADYLEMHRNELVVAMIDADEEVEAKE